MSGETLDGIGLMDVHFANDDLDRLETDPAYDAGLPPEVVRGFRKGLQAIRAAPDERALVAMKHLQFRMGRGPGGPRRTMSLHLRWRLILEVEASEAEPVAVIVGIEGEHQQGLSFMAEGDS
jgi:toxin HigB-1